MKINEKTLYAFASSKPVDREGFLSKRGDVNKAFQRRWFVLKGNLLFYYEKKGSVEPLGMVILEGCVIELADYEEEKFCFTINFPGNRCYILAAEDQESMELWMKALTTSSYDYMRLMICELQRQLAEIDSTSQSSNDEEQSVSVSRPTRRQNPFDKKTGFEEQSTSKQQVSTISDGKFNELRPAPPPPIINRDTVRNMTIKDDNDLLIFEKTEPNDDFDFLAIHKYFGQSWKELIQAKIEEKEKAEQPLIVL
ncbi:sesquipedalian-1-like [Chironomus tepperi]|uniref:sesquipedalian-1-like n=1 Tax=Chironomus tepperi TaxID=113505 RepID=UPI00391F9E72